MIVVSCLPAMNLSREHGSIFSVPSPVCWKTITSPAFSPQPAVFSQAQVKDFCCLCISWISSPPIPPICLDPSECHPCPRMYWLSFSVVCKIGAFYLFQVTVEQTNKQTTHKTGPRLKNSTSNWCPCRIQTVSCYPLILPVFYASSSSSDTTTSQRGCKVAGGNLSSMDLVVTR